MGVVSLRWVIIAKLLRFIDFYQKYSFALNCDFVIQNNESPHFIQYAILRGLYKSYIDDSCRLTVMHIKGIRTGGNTGKVSQAGVNLVG